MALSLAVLPTYISVFNLIFGPKMVNLYRICIGFICCAGILKKALEDERPPKGLTPNIKHISKAPPHLVIQWNSILHETEEKLTKVLVDYWNDQKLAQGLEFECLRAELEEKEQIDSETWQQILEILEEIKDGVQEEQKARRPTSNRIIKQASKVRLIEPTQSLSSTLGS